jgi:Predicted Fe-S oxidoreductases
MFVLQNNIYIVAGAKRYCIYNLNTQKIYSLDSEFYKIFKHLIDNEALLESVSQSDVEYLLSEGIIAEKGKFLPIIKPYDYKFNVSFAWIEITQNCNLLCRHCYEGSTRKEKKPEISFDNFKVAVNSLKSIGVNRIQLVGGEPLMHSKIDQLIEYVAQKFSFIEIFTNGTLLTDRTLDLIKRYNISLALSVYSENPALHDYVTCTKGSFELTYEHIKNALSREIEVRIASVEMKDTPKFQFSDLNVLHRTDLPRLTGRANLSLYSRDMLKRKLITKNSFKKPISPQYFFKNRAIHNCFGERMYIDYDLNVFPCAMERRVCYGNLRSKCIHEMLGSELARMTKDKINGCKDCEYRYACYDCRCDANNASLDSKPWYCTYNQNEGVWVDEDEFIDNLLSKMESDIY